MTHPQVVLVGLAYAYLASAFIGMAVTRLRPRGGAVRPEEGTVTTTPPADRPAGPGRDADPVDTAATAARQAFHQVVDGSVIVTVVPTPRSLSTPMRPPFSSTLRFAIVSPSPVPVALVEK